MSQTASPFSEVVDAVGRLTPEEQETLLSIVQRRLREEHRRQIVTDVKAAQAELDAGKVQPTDLDDLMCEIDS